MPGSVGKPTGDDSGAVIAPTQPPLSVTVEHAVRYRTPVGSVWVLGEVFNSTDQPVENVQVYVALLDAAGQGVASDTPFVALDAVPPGGRAPFGVLFSAPPDGVIVLQSYVVRADSSYNYGDRYAGLQVSDLQTQQEGTQYRVSGKVANTGMANAAGAQIVVEAGATLEGEGVVELSAQCIHEPIHRLTGARVVLHTHQTWALALTC